MTRAHSCSPALLTHELRAFWQLCAQAHAQRASLSCDCAAGLGPGPARVAATCEPPLFSLRTLLSRCFHFPISGCYFPSSGFADASVLVFLFRTSPGRLCTTTTSSLSGSLLFSQQATCLCSARLCCCLPPLSPHTLTARRGTHTRHSPQTHARGTGSSSANRNNNNKRRRGRWWMAHTQSTRQSHRRELAHEHAEKKSSSRSSR